MRATAPLLYHVHDPPLSPSGRASPFGPTALPEGDKGAPHGSDMPAYFKEERHGPFQDFPLPV
nr:MAG TPA: hypothetical protein [Caudoviricetes sp.]